MVVGKRVSKVAGAKDALLLTELCASYREYAPLLVGQQPRTCVGVEGVGGGLVVVAAVASWVRLDIYKCISLGSR